MNEYALLLSRTTQYIIKLSIIPKLIYLVKMKKVFFFSAAVPVESKINLEKYIKVYENTVQED